MKTKEELKKYFENGDIPKQEEFWEWQESYWHKDEKLPLDKVDYDFSKKADTNASNLSPQDAQLWKNKIETPTSIQAPQLNGNILTVFYTGENGIQQSKSVDLGTLVTNNIHIERAEYDAAQNIITITQSDGSAFHINLSEFSIIPTANADGSVTLAQEGQDKVILKKVALTGSYNDLSDKPSYTGNDKLQDVINRGNGTNNPIIFQPSEGRAGEINFSSKTYSLWFGNMNTDHTGTYGVGIGYNALPKLTTGQSDIAIGGFAGANLTTGDWNTFVGVNSGSLLTSGSYNVMVGTEAGKNSTTALGCTYVGDEAGVKNIDGKYNTTLGIGSGYWLTHGVQNTFLGAFAGQNYGKVTTSGAWGSNTFIGYNAASTTHAMGVWGDNNVVIGCNAPLGGSTFNKLVIESNPVARRHDFVTPLIGGDFAARTVDFDAVISAKRTPLADSSYTKVAVLNDGNVFGYKNLSDLTDFVPLSGTAPVKPITGNLVFDNTNGNRELKGAVYGSYISFLDDGVIEINNNYNAGSNVRISGIDFTGTAYGSSGMIGSYYYGDSYQENSFIQKKYSDKQHSYTTKEEKTGGLWINNKPVYKKTLFLDQIPRTGEFPIDKIFEDMEVIVSNQMFTEWYALDVAFAGNQWMTKAFITLENKKVRFELAGVSDYDYSLINSFALTLEYTKKNDSPV
ncbi:hypothetical protein [Chryseobacterium sp. 'Rf worker isolate 10']|uniref:hypothetical protein n=1 Tax=Chryseobacterium sp. 'Rf worker isolate 10' TaxID=2887348 RepID=UPI003D6ED578